jgi:starch synthase
MLRSRRDDLWGIVNGIDTDFFDPARDPHIAAHYRADDQTGKAVCKAALQQEAGLAVDPTAPLFGVIGRLVEQKGVDLLTAVAPWLLDKGAQLVVLGTGDPSYEAKWRELATKARGRLALTLGFDAALAQRIYAGADLFLMPSRFEPCGLGQLISLRYGTIPVVRAVGGLVDTVHDVDTDARRGNGFSFAKYEAAAFADAIERSLHRYRAGREPWIALRARAMREDHSWTASAKRYVRMYTAAAEARRAA